MLALGALICASTGRAQSVVIGRDMIPQELENAYVKGLKFLVKSQNADGSFGDAKGGGYGGYGQEPGVVGLAVVAMLAHGDDPQVGPYKDAISRGIRFIISKADTKTGQIKGPMQSMYSHGFATLALAEAYGMVDDPAIGPTLQKAVDLILASQKQNPEGAWRYQAEAKDADSTVAGAQMVALMAARNAGLVVPDEAIEKGLKYYKSCQAGDGGVAYGRGQGGGGITTTAIGMLVYTLARQKDTPFYRAAGGFFRKMPVTGGQPFYHEYYAAQAAFHYDESVWQSWNATNLRRMLRMQDSNGSWSQGAYGGDGTLYTSFALLSMALNYRYLPIYER
jgi:prenyltransferase beta subunit